MTAPLETPTEAQVLARIEDALAPGKEVLLLWDGKTAFALADPVSGLPARLRGKWLDYAEMALWAQRIIAGEPQATTHPRALQAMAAALLGSYAVAMTQGGKQP